MRTYTIPALRRHTVIIMGDANTAREAVAEWVNPARPMSNVGYSRHATHATVYCEREQLESWFAATHDRRPGALLFFQSH